MTSFDDKDDVLSDRAIEWVVLLHSGSASAADRDAFSRWRRTSPGHEAAASEAEAIWATLGTAGEKVRGRARMTRRAFLGVAAAGVVGVGLVRAGLIRTSLLSDHVTGIGERRTIDLADGTRVLLNARSALSIHFDARERRVALDEGQATFTVAHDTARLFRVEAGAGRTTAVGTVFDVDIRPADVAVTVLDGTVSVRAGGREEETVRLNQRIRYTDEGTMLAAEAVDADIETAWRRGKLVFSDRRLSDVVAELERYRGGRIVLVGSRLQALSVTGVFDLNDPESVLATIRETLPVRVNTLPLVTIIRPA